MTTAPKSPSKRGKAKVEAGIASTKAEKTYAMPVEVQDWIERANSTIQHLRGQVDRLKTENEELKTYKKWAENRILKSDYE